MSRFGEAQISDQKRLVRGEHLLHARTLLRARDHSHHERWRVLVLAGGAPSGEIKAIRELMPKAVITAVDQDQSCCDAALAAGADEALCCDLTQYNVMASGPYRQSPNPVLLQNGKYDLVHLDLCGTLTPEYKRCFRINRGLVAGGGVYIATFSYGRDVTEAFVLNRKDYLDRGYGDAADFLSRMAEAGFPQSIADRLFWLLSDRYSERALASVMTYLGAAAPMCSLLMHSLNVSRPAFVHVEPGDFEIAVVMPNPALLYDCPSERILAMRRSFSAQRAVQTRRARAEAVSA